METNAIPNCASCRFLKLDTHSVAGAVGRCHRYPPNQSGPYSGFGGWPLMQSHDWCGEYQVSLDKPTHTNRMADQ